MYVLFFIEMDTRRERLALVTANPVSGWVTQQARNLCYDLADRARPVKFMIRDRDTKFSASFDAVFAAEGIRIIKTPVRAPRANAVAERFVGTARRECLDRLLVLGRGHVDYFEDAAFAARGQQENPGATDEHGSRSQR